MSRYCGIALYFSNSLCHWAAVCGGTTPVTGFHSTIDSPDSVTRVAPPTTTMRKTRPATANSQKRMARRLAGDGANSVCMEQRLRKSHGPYRRALAVAIVAAAASDPRERPACMSAGESKLLADSLEGFGAS